MKKLFAALIFLLLMVGRADAAFYANYFTTNANPVAGGGGIVSNATLAFDIYDGTAATRYTNSTTYYASVKAVGVFSGTNYIMCAVSNSDITVFQNVPYYFHMQQFTGNAASNTLEFLVPPGGLYRVITNGNTSATAVGRLQQVNYFATNGASGGGGSGTTYTNNSGYAGLVVGSGIGTNTSAAQVAAIMATNNALWLGMTNYTASAQQRATNRVTLSGFGSASANGSYYYNATTGSFTNSSGSGLDFSFDVAAPYITNGASYLYQALTFPTAWDVSDGTPPSGTGYIPTNTVTGSGYRAANDFPFDFINGAQGSTLNFGSGTRVSTGPQVNLSGTIYDSTDFPSAVVASKDIWLDGTLNFVASSFRITNSGSRILTMSSSAIDGICTNADIAIISSEFGIVRNGQGLAAIISSSGFGDYSPSGTYAVIGAASWTNINLHFSTIIGGSPGNGLGASLYEMDNSVGVNTGSSTNRGAYYSTFIGDRQVITNVAYSTIIGSQMRVVGATNNFLLGSGLASTSNNVAKIGFTGWHLLMMTNKLQLISNGVPFNITLSP